MNKVFLIGNLTKDPELTTTNTGISVCRFSIAVSRRFGQNETDFFNIVVWRTQGENCHKYLKKGSKVAIVGSIQNRSYEGNDGVRKYITDIVAEEVQFLSSRSSNDNENADSKTMSDLQPVDEDVPF